MRVAHSPDADAVRVPGSTLPLARERTARQSIRGRRPGNSSRSRVQMVEEVRWRWDLPTKLPRSLRSCALDRAMAECPCRSPVPDCVRLVVFPLHPTWLYTSHWSPYSFTLPPSPGGLANRISCPVYGSRSLEGRYLPLGLSFWPPTASGCGAPFWPAAPGASSVPGSSRRLAARSRSC